MVRAPRRHLHRRSSRAFRGTGAPFGAGRCHRQAAAEQVATVKPASAQLLLDYFEAVLKRSNEYLQTVSSSDLDRVLNEPQWNPMPTVGVRLVSYADWPGT